MEVILLKSSACLLAFISFYKVFLERTSNHQFKRFYLLGVVLLSIGIPFITFIEYIEPQFVLGDFGYSMPNLIEKEALPVEESTNHLPIILWSIYGFGVLLFSSRFVYNLGQIFVKINKNPKQRTSSFISVLLQDYVTPHTFFNYVFLNKTKFENKEIPKEVLLHEETHAKQKHSFDILFIEILQVIFWFNPLVYLLKRDIKLNHEFLADQAVIHQGVPLTNYQQLLLEFSSNSSTNQLANAINYSLIKKRFTIMKTKTSKQSLWIRSLLILPLLAILIYGFSTTKQVEKDIVAKISTDEALRSSGYSSTKHTARSISIELFENGTYKIEGINANKETFVSVINQLHQDITPEVRNKIMNIHLSSSKDISNEDVWFIYNSILDYGFHRIVSDGQEVIREKGNKPFTILNNHDTENTITKQKNGVSEAMMSEYNNFIITFNKTRRINYTPYNRIVAIYGFMSKEQKASVEKYPEFPLSDLSKVKAKKPTKAKFEAWKDKNKFALWVDGKNIKNSELENYSIEDIAHYTESKVHSNARSEKFPQPYQFHLYTKKGFETTFTNWKKDTAALKLVEKELQNNSPILQVYKEPFKLVLNGKETHLKILKEDFNNATNGEKSDLRINAVGAIDFNLIKNIMKETEGTLEKIVLSDGAYIEDKTDYNNAQKTLPTINGILCDKCQLNLSKEGIEKLVLGTNNNQDVLSFKIKFPGNPTQTIKGNRGLNKDASSYLQKASLGTMVQIFDIKTHDDRFGPILITIVNKDDKNYSHSPKVVKGELSDVPPPPAPKVVKGELSELPPPPPPPTKAPQYVNGKKLTLKEIIKKTPKGVESGYEMLDNGESHYYTVYKGKKTYYNKDGYITDNKGNILPPPPPAPKSPLDHVIDMAKKGATFYFEGKKITSDEAIKLLKENKSLNISSNTNDGVSTIKITKKGIKVEN